MTVADPVQVIGFVGVACVVVLCALPATTVVVALHARWRFRRARRAALAARERQRSLRVIPGGLSAGDVRARELAGPPEWGWPPRS